MIIATGGPESHETPLPLDQSQSPAVVAPTAVADSGMVQGGVYAPVYADQVAAGEADAAAAMSSGMAADDDRRQGYAAGILGLGGHTGDLLTLPDVPANMVPPTDSDWYYGTGDEPVEAG